MADEKGNGRKNDSTPTSFEECDRLSDEYLFSHNLTAHYDLWLSFITTKSYKSKKEEAEAYTSLGWALMGKSKDAEGKRYLERSYELCLEMDDNSILPLLADNYYFLWMCELEMDGASKNHTETEAIAKLEASEPFRDEEEKRYLKVFLAYLYSHIGEQEVALDHALEFLDSINPDEKQHSYGIVQATQVAIYIYIDKEEYQEAIALSKRILDLLAPLDINGYLMVLLDLAMVYQYAEDTKKANGHIVEAYRRIGEVREDAFSDRIKAIAFAQYGSMSYEEDKIDVAIEHLEKGLGGMNKKEWLYTNSCLNLAHSYYCAERYDKAYHYYGEVLASEVAHEDSRKIAKEFIAICLRRWNPIV